MVPAGLRAGRHRPVRPLRRRPRRAVSAVRGSDALARTVPRRRAGCGGCAASRRFCLWCPGSPTSCPTSPRRRAPTRTPNAMHCSTQSLRCWSRLGKRAGRSDTRRPALGGQATLLSVAPSAALRRARARADRRHLPQHRSRPLPSACGDARRSSPRRLGQSPATRRTRRGRRDDVRRRGRLRRRRACPGVGFGDGRQSVLPHRGAASRR